MTREVLLGRILKVYNKYYDVKILDEELSPLIVTAEFHERRTGYILVKRAETWSADRHEYLYIYSMEHLSKDLYLKCIAQVLEMGEPLINPVKGHMSTTLSALFLCNTADKNAVSAIKRTRIHKNYKFSLRGWMEVQASMVTVDNGGIVTNSAGRNTKKFLKSIITSRKRS